MPAGICISDWLYKWKRKILNEFDMGIMSLSGWGGAKGCYDTNCLCLAFLKVFFLPLAKCFVECSGWNSKFGDVKSCGWHTGFCNRTKQSSYSACHHSLRVSLQWGADRSKEKVCMQNQNSENKKETESEAEKKIYPTHGSISFLQMIYKAILRLACVAH